MKLLIAWDGLQESDLEEIRKQTGATLLLAQGREQALELAGQAEVILGSVAPEVLEKAVNCRWLQTPFAGVERILNVRWGNPEMIVTNGSGIFGAPMAEHVLGLLLAFNRGLHQARDYQKRGEWPQAFAYPFRELSGATVGILGYGDIGSEIAKRLVPFGCEIIGFRQHPQGNEPFAARVYSIQDFDKHAHRFHYLIAALPQTEKTMGFLHKKRLQRLAAQVIVINVGRGSLFVAEDLVSALRNGWIAGAALDVTEPEPLPASSPLWQMENVIITPHISGYTPFHKKRLLEIFFANWQGLQTTGRPQHNVVDGQKGY